MEIKNRPYLEIVVETTCLNLFSGRAMKKGGIKNN